MTDPQHHTTTQLGGSMARKEELQRQLRAIADELALLEERPSEPNGPNPTITFGVRFHQYGETYTYAARKSNGRWFVTGPKDGGRARSWEQLLDWIEAENVNGLKGAQLTEMTGGRIIT